MPPPPPAGDGETAQAPPPATTETPPPPATETPPPATTETPPPPAEAPPAGASQVSNNTNFVNTILEFMNRERAAVGVPPLVWSNSLAAGAQAWADYEASLNRSFHSTDAQRGPLGETIAEWGPRGPMEDVNATLIRVQTMLNFWINEKNLYHGETIELTNYQIFGHYTQIVWRQTTEIGCGMATGSNGNDFLVCRYNPMGNWVGQKPY
jgi:hypothetical protein